MRGRLNSPIILSWLYLGINRNPRKCIHPCFRKNCDSAQTFLHIAQFRMKVPDEITDRQNVWSYRCPRCRRGQARWDKRSHVMTTTKYGAIHHSKNRFIPLQRSGVLTKYLVLRYIIFTFPLMLLLHIGTILKKVMKTHLQGRFIGQLI